MNRSIWLWIAGLAVIAGVIGGNWYWRNRPPPEPVARRAPTPPPPAPVAPQEPRIAFPIDKAAADAPPPDPRPLPALAQSDAIVTEALIGLLTQLRVQQFVNLQDIVRRIVVVVDNLPREKIPQQLTPLRRTPGNFQIAGNEPNQTIAAANAARYRPAVQALEAIDTRKLVAAYVRLYPLFQQMYEELGYPGRYFNDRLVAVLDHVIATPVVDGPQRVTQPKVFFVYEDAALEARSAGNKLLMRMGEENASRVRAKLREIRNAVAGHRP